MTNISKILVVDDEEFNLDILTELLSAADYNVISAENGQQGLDKLRAHPDVSVIVLDRMMPTMNGMEMLRELKASEQWKSIPVIMQTAAASSQQILEGIQAGVYYYLAKPYDESLLLSIVRAALQDFRSRAEMQSAIYKQRSILGLMQRARFHFRTLEEASNLAYYMAGCFPKPDEAVYGLSELMVNAIEHGNLGISYDEKGTLVQNGGLQAEIERRLRLPENRSKFAVMEYETQPGQLTITIRDEGKGFDWKHYLDFSPARAMDPNGRGIALTKVRAFPNLEYQGAGNIVVCRVRMEIPNP